MFLDYLVRRKEVSELSNEVIVLKDEKKALEEKVAKLELKAKIEEEDIRHMRKKEQEIADIKFQKKEMKIEREKIDAIAKVKDEYRDKVEKGLNDQITGVKATQKEIMGLVPKIRVGLKGEVG